MKRKVLAILLAALMLTALLAACGGGSGGGSNKFVGKYYLSRLDEWTVKEYADLVGMTEQEAKESMYLELKSGGKATFCMDDEPDEVNWKVEGEKITLSLDGDSMEGTIKDNVITFDLEGEILELTKG